MARRLPCVLALSLLLALAAGAKEPDLTAEQKERLARADALEREAARLLPSRKIDEAEVAVLEALDLKQRILGRKSPALVPTLRLLADVYTYRQGGHANIMSDHAALVVLERAVAILDAAPGKPSPGELAKLLDMIGKLSGCADARLALDVHERRLGALLDGGDPADPAVTEALTMAALSHDRPESFWGMDDRRAALAARAETVLAAVEAKSGAESLEAAAVLRPIGILARGVDPERAGAALGRALAIRQAKLPPDDLLVADSLVDLARHDLDRGDSASCRAHLAAGQAIWRKKGVNPLISDEAVIYAKNPETPDHGKWLTRLGMVLDAIDAYRAAKASSGAASSEALAATATLLAGLMDATIPRETSFALAIGDELVAGVRAKSGAGSAEYANALVTRGRLLLLRGRAAAAEADLREALRIRGAKLGKRDPLVADAHAAVGFALGGQERFAEAAAEYARALEIRSPKGAEPDAEAVRVSMNLAWACWLAGEYDRAHEVMDLLFARLPASLPKMLAEGADRKLFQMLRVLCEYSGRVKDESILDPVFDAPGPQAWLRRGAYPAALEGLRAIAPRGGGGLTDRTPLDKTLLLMKIQALVAVGAEDEAIADLIDLTEWLRKTAPTLSTNLQMGTWAVAAPSFTLLAEALLARGMGEEAAAIGELALTSHLSLPAFLLGGADSGSADGPEKACCGGWVAIHPRRAPGMETRAPEVFARTLLATGDRDRALRVLEDTLTGLETQYPPDHPRVAETVVELARVHLAAGNRDEARALAEEALAAFRKSLGKEHPSFAGPLLVLADADLLDGKHRAAEKRYGEVLALAERYLTDAHLNFPLALSGIALARARDGRAAEGVKPMREALGLVGRRARSLFSGATVVERTSLMASVTWGLSNWLVVSGAAGQAGYDEVLRLKGYLGRAMALEERAWRGEEGKAREVHEELRAAQQRLARLAWQAPYRGWARFAWRRQVAEAAERCADLSKSLARASRDFVEMERQLEQGVDAVQRRLGKGEALVDVLLAGGRYTAFVLGPKGDPARIDLGPEEDLDPRLADFREAAREVDSVGDARFRETGAALRKAFWEPIAGALPEGTATVYLVPDGPVCAVPLRALPRPEAGGVLDDEILLVLLSNAFDLVPRQPAPGAGRGLLVVGGVNYDATDRPQLPGETGLRRLADRVPGARSFVSLPATVGEAAAVSALVKGAGGGPVKLLDSERATEGALRESAPGCRILHLATHGFIQEKMNSSLRLPPEVEYRLQAGLEIHAQRFDPFLFTGIALSGANQRVIENDEDGILTALEAMALDLDGVRLVTLSACETALGVEQAGDGVYGLVRAFLLAGAESVVASLWPVSDDATGALMEAFYRRFLPSAGSPAEALRAAAGELRAGSRFAAPRHWAAFVAYSGSEGP